MKKWKMNNCMSGQNKTYGVDGVLEVLSCNSLLVLNCASTVAALGDFLYCSVTLRKTSSNETSCKPYPVIDNDSFFDSRIEKNSGSK
jgi:hypothetical protein